MNKFTEGLAAFGSLDQSAPAYFADDGATGYNLTTEDKADPEYLAGLQSAALPVRVSSTSDEALNTSLSVLQGLGSFGTTTLDGISALAAGETWGSNISDRLWNLDDFRTNNAKRALTRDSYLKLAREQEEHYARVRDENAGMSLGERNFTSLGRATTNDLMDFLNRKSGEGFVQDTTRVLGEGVAMLLASRGIGAVAKSASRIPGLSGFVKDGQALAKETGLSALTPVAALSSAGDYGKAVQDNILNISDDDIFNSPEGRAEYERLAQLGASPEQIREGARKAYYKARIQEFTAKYTFGIDLLTAMALDKTLGRNNKAFQAALSELIQESVQTAQANLDSRRIHYEDTGSLENAPGAGEGVFDAAIAGGFGGGGSHASAIAGAAGVGTYRFGKKLGEAGAKAYQAGKEAYDKTKSSVKEELLKKAKAKENQDNLKTPQQAAEGVNTQPEGNPSQEATQAPVEANTASQTEPTVVERKEGSDGFQGYTKMSDGKFYDDNGHEIITKKTLEAQGMKNYEVEAYLAKNKPTHMEVPGGRGFVYTEHGEQKYGIQHEEPAEDSQPEAQPTAEELEQNLTNKVKNTNQQTAEDASYLDSLASTAEQDTSAYETPEVKEAPVYEEPNNTVKGEEPVAQVNTPELPKSNDSPARVRAKQEALKPVLTAEDISVKAKEAGVELSEDDIKRYNKARESVANLLAPDDVVVDTFYPKEIREKYKSNPRSFDNIYKDFIKVAQDKKAPSSERLRAEMYLKNFYTEVATALNSSKQEDEEFSDLFVQNPQAVEAIQSIAKYIDSNPKVNARENTLDKYANTLQDLDSNFIENFIKAFDEGKVDKSDLENETLYSENRNLLDRFKSKSPVQASEGSAVAALNKALSTARARTKLTDNRDLRSALNLARKFNKAEGNSTKEIDRVFKETMSKETGEVTSARGLMSRISRELKKAQPNMTKVQEQALTLKNFAESKLSKAKAMHTALASAVAKKEGYRVTPEPYKYEALNPKTGTLYLSKSENQKMSTAPVHLALANLATEEAKGVADAYNSFIQAYPELGLNSIKVNFNPEHLDTLNKELAKANTRIEKKLSNAGSANELQPKVANTKSEPAQMVQNSLNKSNQRGNNNEETSRLHEEAPKEHSSVHQGSSTSSLGKSQSSSSQDLGNHARSMGSNEANGQGSLGTNQRTSNGNEEANSNPSSSDQRQARQSVREERTEVSSKKVLEEGTNNKVPSSKKGLEPQKMTLNTGDARGADSAFVEGARKAGFGTVSIHKPSSKDLKDTPELNITQTLHNAFYPLIAGRPAPSIEKSKFYLPEGQTPDYKQSLVRRDVLQVIPPESLKDPSKRVKQVFVMAPLVDNSEVSTEEFYANGKNYYNNAYFPKNTFVVGGSAYATAVALNMPENIRPEVYVYNHGSFDHLPSNYSQGYNQLLQEGKGRGVLEKGWFKLTKNADNTVTAEKLAQAPQITSENIAGLGSRDIPSDAKREIFSLFENIKKEPVVQQKQEEQGYVEDTDVEYENDYEAEEAYFNSLTPEERENLSEGLKQADRGTNESTAKEAEEQPTVDLEKDSFEPKVHKNIKEGYDRLFKRSKDAIPLSNFAEAMSSLTNLKALASKLPGSMSKLFDKVKPESIELLHKNYFTQDKIDNFTKVFNEEITKKFNKNHGIKKALTEMQDDDVDISRRNFVGEGYLLPLVQEVKVRDDYDIEVTLDPAFVKNAYLASVLAMIQAEVTTKVDVDKMFTLDGTESDNKLFWQHFTMPAEVRSTSLRSIPLSSMIDKAIDNFEDLTGLSAKSDVSPTEVRQVFNQLVGSAFVLTGSRFKSMGQINRFKANGNTVTISTFDPLNGAKGETVELKETLQEPVNEVKEQLVYTLKEVNKDNQGNIIKSPTQEAVADSRYALSSLAAQGKSKIPFLVTEDYGSDKENTLKVPSTITNSGGKPLHEETKKAIEARQAVEYKVNPVMTGIFKSLGLQNMLKIFGEYLSTEEKKDLNPAYVLAAEGKNANIESAFNNLEMIVDTVDALGGDAGVHFAYQANLNSRLQMVGSGNPQSAKIIREGISAVMTNVDLTNPTKAHHYALCIAQGLGVKVQNFTMDTKEHKKNIARDLLSALEAHADTIDMLQKRLDEAGEAKDYNFSEEDVQLIKSQLTEPLGKALEFAVLVEVANLLNTMGINPSKEGDKKAQRSKYVNLIQSLLNPKESKDKLPSSFASQAYLEMDGVQNGPFNAVASLTTNSDLSDAISAYNRGGLHIATDGKALTLSDVRTRHVQANGDPSQARDSYEEATVSETKSQQELSAFAKSDRVNANVKQVRQATEDLVRFLLPDQVEFAKDSNGEVVISKVKRLFMKNPLTVFVYGAGTRKVSDNVIYWAFKNFYALQANAQRKVKEHGGEVSEWLFFDRYVKMGYSEEQAKKYSKNISKRLAKALSILAEENSQTYAGKYTDFNSYLEVPRFKSLRKFNEIVKSDSKDDTTLTLDSLKSNEEIAKDTNFKKGNLVFSGQQLKNIQDNFFNYYGENVMASLESIMPKSTLQNIKLANKVASYTNHLSRLGQYYFASQARFVESGRDTWELSKEASKNIAKDLAALNLSFDSGLSNIVLNPDKVKSAETRAPGLAISGYQVAMSKPLTGGIGVKMIPSMVQGNGDAYMMHLLAGTRNTTDVFDGLNIGVNDIEALGSAPNRAAGIAALQNPFDQMVDTLSRILKVYADNPVIFEKYHKDWRDTIKIENDDSASLEDKKKALIKQAELTELFNPDFEKNLLGATKDDDGATQENRDLNKYYRKLQKSRDKKSNNESFEDTDLKDLFYEFMGNRQNVFSYGRTYTHLAIDQAESIARQHQLLMVAGFSVDQMAGASAPHLFENQKGAYAQIRTDARKALEGKSFANDNALQVAYLKEVQKGLSKYEKENGDAIKAKYDKLRDEVDELCERGTEGISEKAKYSFKNLDQALHGINISKNKGISAPIRGLLKSVISEQKGLGNKTLYFQGSKEDIVHMLREKLGRPEAAKEMQKQMNTRSINGFHMVIDGITYVFVDTSTVTSYEQLGEVIAHEAIHAATQNMLTDYYSGKEMDPEDVEAIQHIEALARKFYNLEVSAELAKDSNFAGAFLNAETLIAPSSTAKEKARAAKEFIAYALSSAKVSSIIHEMKNDKTLGQRLKNIISSLTTWFMKLLTRGHVDLDSMSRSELMHLRYDLARLMAYDLGKKPNGKGPDDNGGGGHGMTSSDETLFSENKTLQSDFDRDVGSKSLGEMLAERPFSNAIYKALALHKLEREVDSLARRAEKDAKAMSHWDKVDVESHKLASIGEQVGVLKSLEEKQAYIENFMIFSNHQFPELSKNYLNKLSMALDEVLPVLRTKFTKDQMDFIEGNHSKKFKNAAMVSAMLSSPEIMNELGLLIPEGFQEDSIGETLSAFKDAALGDIHVSKDLTYGDLALMFRDRLKETIEVGRINKQTEMTVEVPTEDETTWHKIADEVYNNRFLTRLNNAVVSAKDSFIEDFTKMVPNQLLKFMLTAFHSNTDGLADNIMKWSLRNFESQTVMALIRDITGRTKSNKGVFDLIKLQKYRIATMRQQIKERIISNLNRAWKEAFYNSAEQREAFAHMTQAFIKTDIGSVSADGKELVDLVANPDKIPQKIKELEDELAKTSLEPEVIQYYTEKAKVLAEYMTTGKFSGFFLRNPLAIVSNLENKGDSFEEILKDENKELKNQVIHTLDKLTSLYAYNGLDKNLKHEMLVLAQNEPQAMQETLETARGMNYEMQGETRYSNFNEFKGYVPRISKNGEKVIVAPEDQREYYEQCGYIFKGTLAVNPLAFGGKNLAYFYAPMDPEGSWNTQILQTSAWTRRGVDLRSGKSVTGSTFFLKRDLKYEKEHKKEERNYDGLIPVFDDRGRLKGWETVLDPEVLGAVTLNESITEVIGSVRSRIYEETQARAFNDMALKIIDDMAMDVPLDDRRKDFINILDPVLALTLPIHIQEAITINRPLIIRWLIENNHLTEEESKESDKAFFIRKDLLEDVLGYRSASIGDIWTGKSNLPVPVKNGIKAVFDSIFGKNALKVALHGEKITQMVVGELKSIIVVKSGIVPMINLASNILQLTSRGVPIMKSVKYIRHAWKELEQYYKYYDRKVTLATQGDFTPEKRAEIQRLNERITSLSIYPLIGQGELGTVANLGNTDENLEIFKGRYGEMLNDAVEKLPKWAQTVARYGYLSKDTDLYKFLEKMSQWGDVVSKYALTEYLKETGMQEQEALDQAKQEYAHYDASPGRLRGYVESVGGFWFGNFMLRSAKIGHNMITKNPVQSLLAAALPFPDVTGTPITDNVFAKALKGTLDYSIGPGMATRGISLNPWVNGVFD